MASSSGVTPTAAANTAAPLPAQTPEQAAFDLVGARTGIESALSNYVGPYVTEMLGRGQALASQPYEAYTGTLTAGPSNLQQTAFQGLASLAVPTQEMGAFAPQSFTDAGVSQQYMNPFVQQALQPQLEELRRQTDIARIANAGRMTKAGAFGGGRQAVYDAELDRALLDKTAQVTGQGLRDAYNQAANQFNIEQGRGQTAQDAANMFGLTALQRQADLGNVQRAIESEGIAADIQQFENELAFPYKQTQYMQALLQNLPLRSQDYTYAEPSRLEQFLAGTGGISQLNKALFGGDSGGIGGILSKLGGSVMDAVGGGLGDLFVSGFGDDVINTFDFSGPITEDSDTGSFITDRNNRTIFFE